MTLQKVIDTPLFTRRQNVRVDSWGVSASLKRIFSRFFTSQRQKILGTPSRLNAGTPSLQTTGQASSKTQQKWPLSLRGTKIYLYFYYVLIIL
jgi:hypothetical protein